MQTRQRPFLNMPGLIPLAVKDIFGRFSNGEKNEINKTIDSVISAISNCQKRLNLLIQYSVINQA